MYACYKLKKFTALSICCIILGSMLMLGGCGDEDNPVAPPPSNPYAGSWSTVFAGSYTGGGTISIGSDGRFSTNVLLSDGTNTFTNTITGSVDNNGQMLNGQVFYSGSQIGTVTGQFLGNAGSGDYQTAQPSAGTWSATRN